MNTFDIKKILIPVDFSETGKKAISQAIIMAKRNDATIALLHVAENLSDTYGPDYLGMSKSISDEFEAKLHVGIEESMDMLKEDIIKQGVRNVECYLESGKVYKAINKVAKDIEADIIMMGTHGVSGLKEIFVGSNTFKLISVTTCPVLSLQSEGPKDGFSSILLPFRDRPHSRESVEYAIRMAKMFDATIHVLGINIDPDKEAESKVKYEAEQIKGILEKRGIKYTIDILTDGFVANLILSFAKNIKADLIVIMADLDKMELKQYFLGPVSQQIVNHSAIPVLSIHPAFHITYINQANPIMN
jgi:nucleotide-binding universal stress UspA family protein